MKAITFLATLLITIVSCNCQKDSVSSTTLTPELSMQKEMPIIKYEANSRGLALAVKIENQVVYVSRVRDFKDYEEKVKISDSDWKEIESLTKAVDLSKVKDLKWPTEKRYYDGAAHANIIFISGGVEYPANGFDHGFPPVEIEKLVNKILKLTEK
ncbi:hypothetical protein [Flavobacterium lacisediminis]|uniref:Lipoprotein n=1 Tax=Flavobacterium lacisediminis TaxID=2989705 RepID=A0ABT3EEG7_9FLAO|nr:hypothetical protein [Flavobacterium lacisediminis]MCW1146965.1 hypothetical protein [Flavobacterium lacisediminis]